MILKCRAYLIYSCGQKRHKNISLSRTFKKPIFFRQKLQSRVRHPRKTQNICITFIRRQPHVFDVGPTLYKCYADVLCFLV